MPRLHADRPLPPPLPPSKPPEPPYRLPGGWTTRALAAASGVSLSMVQYFVRHGLLTPSRDLSGTWWFTDADLAFARQWVAWRASCGKKRGRRRAVPS